MRQILKEFGLTTMDGECFSDETLKKSNLFPLYSYQEHDDVIEGCYNEVNYTIAETKLVVKNRKNEYDVFKGVVISFKSNKKILAETFDFLDFFSSSKIKPSISSEIKGFMYFNNVTYF